MSSTGIGETGDRIVLVDSHAHLELEPLVKDPAGVVARASEAGVEAIITVGIDLEDVDRALTIADQFPEVHACVGFHPHNAKGVRENSLAMMEERARHPKVVGYGEIGLDFFRNWSPRDAQIRVFREQLALAKDLGKPVVIHLRNAYSEGLKMLREAGPFPAGGVIHCFSGTAQDARDAMDLGFHISVPGTVTYRKNHQLQEIVRDLPADRLLLETDSPFLSPEPLRGKDNEPAFIIHTAKKVAEIRGTTPAEIARTTTRNSARLFGLPVKFV
jgi:TatD DNase family protein